MGVGCSFTAEPSRNKDVEEQGVLRWRGHELYSGSCTESGSPSEGSISPTRQRLTDEIKAMYTCNQTETLTIIHFNDVYNIEAGDSCSGGAARFATVVRAYDEVNPLVLFSGDCLNPSILSTFTKGEHMVPVLNALGVNTAVYGNHDFDFGVDDLEDIVKETKFPWLLSNVVDDFTGQMLADGLVTRLITWQNKKIGLIGLVEEEWLVTLATVDREDVTFLDYVERGQKLSTDLKEQGADFVIALTHMRMPNDVRLAQETTAIDLILAGHDHDYCIKEVNGTYIVKSGSDFRSLSVITLEFTPHDTSINIQKVVVDQEVVEDEEMKRVVDGYQDVMRKEMDGKLGVVEVDLDARFASIRTQETNLGNLVTDIMLSVLDADVALLNSGTFRSDRTHPAGEFKKRDLLTLLPLIDPLMVLEVTGDQLYEALENGVSQYPKKEGRFPQVSGMRYGFYPAAPSGQRVDPLTVVVDGQCILPDKKYRLCTKEYLASGKDGYKVFAGCPALVTAEEGPTLTTAVQNHFHSAGVVKGFKPCRSGHRQSLVSVRSKPSLVKSSSLMQVEQARARIAPRVEGRIVKLAEEEDKEVEGEMKMEGRKQGGGEEEEDWRETLAAHRRLFMMGSNEDVLAEWERINRLEEGRNEAEIAQNVILHESSEPALFPRVIVTMATTDDIVETGSKGSVVSPSASMISINDDDGGADTLQSAVRLDDVDTVSRLLEEEGGNLFICGSHTTLLHIAAKHNSIHVARYLLQSLQMDPNILHHPNKTTALMDGVRCGHGDIVRLLLEAGASVTMQDGDGQTALDMARGSDHSNTLVGLITEFDQSADKSDAPLEPRI